MHTCILHLVRTTVAMDGGTRDRLERLRRRWGARSLAEVVARLLDGAPLGARALYEARRDEVDAAVRRHHVRRLVAFGSRARGDARPDSDLDLVASLPAAADLLDVARLREELEDAFGLRVSLLTEGSLRGRLKDAVRREGVVLVA